MPNHPLFSSAEISKEINNRSRRLHYEIEHIDGDELLGTSAEDWCEFFESQFSFKTPRLRVDEVSVEQAEEEVNVSRERGRDARRGPVIIQATKLTFHVPFDGEGDLFRFQPDRFTLSPPRGLVADGEFKLIYTRRDHDGKAARTDFDRDLAEIQRWLGWLEESVSSFNDRLPETVRSRIGQRREKVLKDREMAASLGFPLRRAGGTRTTFIVDGPRRRVQPRRPRSSGQAFSPEPELGMSEYEQILATMEAMVKVMERSPKAFATMGEEDLRQHLLVGLNAHYEGQATGETFNFEGKTDILIRANDRNLFIAECKIWKGPKALLDAIEQLLGYTSWRDTKTAIVVFNRNRDFSAVVAKITETVPTHTCFKRALPFEHESGYRCVLHQRSDINRELILTVLAFDVPSQD